MGKKLNSNPHPLALWGRFLGFSRFFWKILKVTAEMCAGKFPLMSMGGWAEGLACADPGARTPIGASGNFITNRHLLFLEGPSPLKIIYESKALDNKYTTFVSAILGEDIIYMSMLYIYFAQFGSRMSYIFAAKSEVECLSPLIVPQYSEPIPDRFLILFNPELNSLFLSS